MSYCQALEVLHDGGCVYRQDWKHDEFLTVSRKRIVLVQQRRIKGIYIATDEDLSALDWMQEHFVMLGSFAGR